MTAHAKGCLFKGALVGAFAVLYFITLSALAP